MKKYLVLVLANIAIFTNISQANNFKRGTGLIFDDEQYNKTLISTPLLRGEYNNLPKSFSIQKYAPIPKNQGSYGTCVGWATAYSARTILYNIKNDITDRNLAVKLAFSPSYVYNQISSDKKCQDGTFIHDALNIIQYQGVPKLSEFIYKCDKEITSFDKELASKNKIKNFKKLFEIYDINKINPVRKSLSENKPVVIGMTCCTSSFEKSYGKDVWDISITDNEPSFGHAMTIVGYDDKKYGGAFLVMNSWGEEWGNKGFIWIRYNDFKRFTKYAYELIESDYNDSLSGELEFKTINGEKMPFRFNNGIYEITKPYYSGTLFRLYVSNNEPAYIYAFGMDSTNKAFKIFPHRDNISPYLGYKKSQFALPDENNYIRMDNTIGYDYFCFLYSKNELDINNLLQVIESEDGSFSEKLNKILGNKLINSSNINYRTSGKIAFSSKSNLNEIVPVIIKMEHK